MAQEGKKGGNDGGKRADSGGKEKGAGHGNERGGTSGSARDSMGGSAAGGALSREDRLNAAPAPAKPATHGKPATGFDKYGMGSAAGMIESGAASAEDVGRLATSGLDERQGAALRGQVTDAEDDGMGGLLGLIGLSERIDPDTVLAGNPNASWGFDPAGLIGGAVGLATGMPFIGTGLALASNLAGSPAEINLGPEVFGGGAGRAPDLASAGRDGREAGLLAGDGRVSQPQQAQAPVAAPGAPMGGGEGSARMSGLLAGEDTDYLKGVTTRRPTPAQRFQPGAYTGRLIWDPAEGRMIPSPGAA